MIISASYKTDIPTFYGEWFINRLRAGYCKMVNPYNRQILEISLQRDHVDGFVFWTKNIGPFLRYLTEIKAEKFPFIIQHTINSYPRTLEFSVTDARRSIANVRNVAHEFGPEVCIWRYDTIVSSSITSYDFHRENFEWIARSLAGSVNEVVISFAHFYRKTLRNMEWAGRKFGFDWNDPSDSEKRQLVSDLSQISKSYGIQLSICSQPQYLMSEAKEAKCVDAERFERILGRAIPATLKGNRKDCGCFQSRDIGEYDTCPHGCVYCYAVQDRSLAQMRHKMHDPTSEFLFAPMEHGRDESRPSTLQLPLFPSD